MYYTPKKVLPFALFFNLPGLQKPERNCFSDRRLDTYEWKQTKVLMIFKLKSLGVLILKCVLLFYFNHILVICFLVKGNMFLVNGNMFLVNGNMFLVSGNMF